MDADAKEASVRTSMGPANWPENRGYSGIEKYCVRLAGRAASPKNSGLQLNRNLVREIKAQALVWTHRVGRRAYRRLQSAMSNRRYRACD